MTTPTPALNQGLTEAFTIAPDDAGERLDVFLADRDALPVSRSQIQRAIAQGHILVNDARPSKSGVRLRAGDRVLCHIPPPATVDLSPEPIPLRILHEDAHLIVLVKPAGLVVHPAPGHPSGTLVNALLYHCADLSRPDGAHIRPGIVHRLDKDTSGVMVVCKRDDAHRALADQFARHTIARRYLALAHAPGLANEGTFDTAHGRHPNDRKRFTGQGNAKRRAITHWRVLARLRDRCALVACTLQTGRTHQIRMHLSEAQAPILGDALYGTRASQARDLARHALHAELLGFDHPATGQPVRFQAPPPDDFMRALTKRLPEDVPSVAQLIPSMHHPPDGPAQDHQTGQQGPGA